MTKDDVQSIFNCNDILQITDSISVDTDVFTQLFADASVNPTHTELVALDNGKGYIPFFDKCKAEGILL